MHFIETKLTGAFIIELESVIDHRGFFGRSFCVEEFKKHGLDLNPAQCNISFNHKKGTLRGMHYQKTPKEEAKLVRCTRGAVYDVIIDLRLGSSTYCNWIGVELTESNYRAIFIPPGFAHGFQTLKDDSELFYQMSTTYAPECATGIRWNDPLFKVRWPIQTELTMSNKDLNYPDYMLKNIVS